MTQHTFLGLSHNPFAAPREGFFEGADRKTHLEHLRNLSQWARRVLIVTGPFGIGKSSLFRELSTNLEANAKAARLSGSVVTSEREILVGILQGFGLASGPDQHVEDIADTVVAHVSEQDTRGRVCIVMVDDAHLLAARALHSLVGLVGRSSLRLLLFGEAGLVRELDRAVQAQELEWFEIRLTGLPRPEVRNYLEWRFRQAHYRGLLPFSQAQLENIVVRSGGTPSVIDRLASELLDELESGEIRLKRGGFPRMHIFLAGSLVILVGLTYLFLEQSQTVPVDSHGAEPSALINPPSGQPMSAPPIPADSTPAAAESTSAVDLSYSQLGQDLAVSPETENATDIRDLESQGLTATADALSLAQRPSSNVSEPNEVDMTSSVSPIEIDTNDAQDAFRGQQDKRNNTADDRVPSGALEPVESTITADDVAVANGPSMAPSAGVKRSSFLLAQDPERFTMQLLTLSSLERAEAFVKRQDSSEEFAIYTINREGKQLFVITYGIFATRELAALAADNFTGELAEIKPWLRRLSGVQQAIDG